MMEQHVFQLKDVKTYESIIKTYVDKMNSAGYSEKCTFTAIAVIARSS